MSFLFFGFQGKQPERDLPTMGFRARQLCPFMICPGLLGQEPAGALFQLGRLTCSSESSPTTCSLCSRPWEKKHFLPSAACLAPYKRPIKPSKNARYENSHMHTSSPDYRGVALLIYLLSILETEPPHVQQASPAPPVWSALLVSLHADSTGTMGSSFLLP